MGAMSWTVFWKAGVLQAVLLAVVAVALAVALPRSFFESWGWLAGPGAWAVCALAVARILRLPIGGVVVGSVLAAVPAFVGVATGQHWLGTVLAVPVFAAWCARLAREPGLPAQVV
jgi:hypothetical protein